MHKNIAIAKWLGWKEGFPHIIDIYGYHQCVDGFTATIERETPDESDTDNYQIPYDELKFDTSIEWLFTCIVKLQDNRHSITEIFAMLENNTGICITTTTDLFNAVYNYIKTENNKNIT